MVIIHTRFSTSKNLVLAGVLLMLGGDFMFALNDAMGKWLVASFSVGQVVLIRSIGAFIVLGPMIAGQGAKNLFRRTSGAPGSARGYGHARHRPVLRRRRLSAARRRHELLHGGADLRCRALPSAAWREGRLAALDRHSHRVLRRADHAQSVLGRILAAVLFALIGSIAFAFAIILGRRLRGTSDTTLVTWQTLGSLVVGAALAIGDWVEPSALDWGAMLLLGVVSCAAHLMITRALKLAPASTLAPLHYSLLLWAVVFGFVFFGDVPSARILIGSCIIVLAGLFIFHRQKVVDTVPPENVPRGVN